MQPLPGLADAAGAIFAVGLYFLLGSVPMAIAGAILVLVSTKPVWLTSTFAWVGSSYAFSDEEVRRTNRRKPT